MKLDNIKIPCHVGIIMDGNGRWAKERGLNRSKGHEAGYKTLKTTAKYILDSGVKVLSVFAFSTENFNRPKEEVDFLMNLFIKGFKKDTTFFNKENIKVVFSGRKEPLKKDVIEAMEYLSESTKNNTKGILNICLNYGGRSEIVDAVNHIIKDNLKEVDEEVINNYLYNKLPDIDLLIRTSGELRLSNFLPWQLVYSEFLFIDKNWPEFEEEDLDKAIIEYQKRTRKFGAN